MCGRFTLVASPEQLAERFQISEFMIDLVPRYNIAPSQMIPAIISDQGERRLGFLRWGLIPSWAKDEKRSFQMINAKSETIRQKSSFKNLVFRKRCLIPSDGFYEWQTNPEGKQPMRIRLKGGKLFSMAGLFDTWVSREGQKIHSCTIITVPANQLISPIHDRMPAILTPEQEDIWLDREEQDGEELQKLLQSFGSDKMEYYPVSPIIGNFRNDFPACIARVDQ